MRSVAVFCTNAVACETPASRGGCEATKFRDSPVEIIDASTAGKKQKGKYMGKKKRKWARLGICSLFLGGLVLGGLLLGARPASALEANVCMQTNYTNHGLSQTLGCTANDVSVARATNIEITAGGSCTGTGANKVCTCNEGGNVTFTADYEVVLTAQARYDIGIYFSADGDPNGDGALTGACKLTTLSASNSTNFINLDPTLKPANKAQPNDVCGDIDSAHNPQILHLPLTVPCTGVLQPDGTKKLKLPNCTSWRESGANDTCDEATDAFPGAPSKCNCEPGFTVDIFTETATIEVTKTASPTTVPETGGSVTYTVAVKNLSQQATLTLDTLTDDLYGDITTTGHDGITDTTCAVGPPAIAAQATYSCTFTVSMPAGDNGGTTTDTVEACGTDSFGHTNLCDDDDAVVTYTDVRETPTLTKTATVKECSVQVTYDVVVTNNSAQDTLTLNTLSDDKFGVITSAHAAGGGFGEVVDTTCGEALQTGGAGTLPAVIAASGNYSCSFIGVIKTCSGTHTNTVTGSATDDDGATYNGTTTPPLKDDAAVSVTVTIP